MASSNEQAQATGELLHARDPSMSRRACMKLLSLVTSVTVHTLRPPRPCLPWRRRLPAGPPPHPTAAAYSAAPRARLASPSPSHGVRERGRGERKLERDRGRAGDPPGSSGFRGRPERGNPTQAPGFPPRGEACAVRWRLDGRDGPTLRPPSGF